MFVGKHVDLLLIGEREKSIVLITDFNMFMYDNALWKKIFLLLLFIGF